MELMTAEEVAGVLGVSRQRVYALIREGVIPSGVSVQLGRQVRVNPDALEEWIRAGGKGFD